MKINIKFLISHVIASFFMAIPFAKAQPLPPCISQCMSFCTSLTSNFTSGGTGPVSVGTLQSLLNTVSQESTVWQEASSFQNFISQLMAEISDNPLLTNCQSPVSYCGMLCDSFSSPANSKAQNQNVAPQKAASVKK